MSNFDEWFNDYHSNNEAYAEQLTKDAFEAGAASRQGEVDSINRDLNHAFATVEIQCEQIDALQKRIDDALALIYKEKSKVECGVFKGVNADLIIGIGYELHLVLKGESK